MCLNTCVIEILTNAYSSRFNMPKMASTSRKSSPIWSFFSVAKDAKYAVCNSCKQKVSRGRATTVSFPVILFHSISNQTGTT